VSHAAPDDLSKPLGAAAPRRARGIALPPGLMRKAGIGIAFVAMGGVAYLAWTGDPLGGEPHVYVPIVRHEAPASAPKSEGNAQAAIPPGRATASELEQAAGVAVVRPDGQAAPGAVVITIPDARDVKLAPAPDPRLVERTRNGLLPKTGEQGVRPMIAYARPAGSLPGGAVPAGQIALVIGGLGISQSTTADAISKLPPAVTLAFAPYGSELDSAVAKARESGHEVMLQAPMQPFDYPDNDPGPQTLTVEAKPSDNLDRLHWVMGRFSGYVGIVNFMGAKITSNEVAMSPILKDVAARGLVYLDDGSSPRSVAGEAAARVQAPFQRANLVVDATAQPEAIDKQLAQLEELARKQGTAIGTASALPLTIERVARWAEGLAAKGILLVPVSAAYPEARG
jgi:polysaccharide deacetylase 2 family uncharacterized protein YibQ